MKFRINLPKIKLPKKRKLTEREKVIKNIYQQEKQYQKLLRSQSFDPSSVAFVAIAAIVGIIGIVVFAAIAPSLDFSMIQINFNLLVSLIGLIMPAIALLMILRITRDDSIW